MTGKERLILGASAGPISAVTPKRSFVMKTDRPNITILVDDMGYSDIGCSGSEITTPHIDRLAANGVQFTQSYNCARCCPSRASLLTGLYPRQAGVDHMVTNPGHPSYPGRKS